MVAKTCKNFVLPESGHGLPQGNWPCVVCPLAKPSCIASQKGVGSVTAAAHSLMIAETTGIRTVVASFPMPLALEQALVVANCLAYPALGSQTSVVASSASRTKVNLCGDQPVYPSLWHCSPQLQLVPPMAHTKVGSCGLLSVWS